MIEVVARRRPTALFAAMSERTSGAGCRTASGTEEADKQILII